MINIQNFESIALSAQDVFHFLGIRDKNAQNELKSEVDSVITEALTAIKPRLCYGIFPCSVSRAVIDLDFCRVESLALAKNLTACKKVAVVCATVGLEIDRLISKYSRISPARALIMQAAGAAAVEAVLDSFSDQLRSEGFSLRPRFSCGYGDLPLSLQSDIFAVLECKKSIGVSLTDSFLMTPTKSVSAIIGLEQR